MGLIPGGEEWLVILLVVLLLFGATAIPKLARSLGRAKGEFGRARDEFSREMKAGEAGSAGAAGAAGAAASEDAVRRSARELGVPEAGKSLDEVKRLIQERLA
jgi:sec-independent protein translocase protein TatA